VRTRLQLLLACAAALAVALPAPALFAAPASPRSTHHKGKRLRTQQGTQQTKTDAAAAPEQSAAIESQPAHILDVSYRSGELSITAQNVSLREILAEIHRLSGATVLISGDAGEQVVARLGPAPAVQVLASLLQGSAFNYVIAGSASDPAAIVAIVLTPKIPQPKVPIAVADELPPAETRRQQIANLTGGDEGSADEVETGMPIPVPSPATPNKKPD
jgi:hypothetical protein